MTLQQLELENARLRTELAKAKATDAQPKQEQQEQSQTLGERYSTLVNAGKTKEAADFLAKNGDKMIDELAPPVPKRDTSMSAREQFATLTDELERSQFWSAYHEEIISNL
jgi:hypothetical protein